jgi:mannose/fructose/N-acetylgalactosamine-specific phosphotransferase system component IIB
MAEILLTRVDYRLIHAQVVSTWGKVANITKLILIDEKTGNDETLVNIYQAAATSNMAIRVYNEEKAVRLWEKNKFGDGTVFLLFKDVPTEHRMWKAGIKLPFVLLGNMPLGPDRKGLLTACGLSKADYELCKEMHDKGGLDVFARIMPDTPKIEWDSIVKALENFS